MKALENMSYARDLVLENMIKTEKSSSQISFFQLKFEEDVRLFKERAIDVLIYCHPPFFKPTLEFDDWRSAMEFLEKNKQTALIFWETQSDDK
tara:strand:- start:545 stop:823 length:279 start_codon:yes stop_codon:yes gene_type:complete